ncbi:hypothetical protein ACFWIJ_25340 [Streptomyces sp. NPDC127079]|uniref:hypothetical protein n=1 Tax=Streptomyces sp. NPDC127079 TaxID=3347132 RepID=UPI00365C147D
MVQGTAAPGRACPHLGGRRPGEGVAHDAELRAQEGHIGGGGPVLGQEAGIGTLSLGERLVQKNGEQRVPLHVHARLTKPAVQTLLPPTAKPAPVTAILVPVPVDAPVLVVTAGAPVLVVTAGAPVLVVAASAPVLVVTRLF